jgi:sugar phosphate permease
VHLRATAQGLINIFNAIGTLCAAAAISAIADFRGGGAIGFSTAYVMVAIVMLAMVAVALRLRRDTPLAERNGFAEEHR